MSSGIFLGDKGTATSTAAAATVNHTAGIVTTEALTTAAGSEYSIDIANAMVCADSVVMVSVQTGTNTKAGLMVSEVTPSAGSINVKIKNTNAAALDGTIKISFAVLG